MANSANSPTRRFLKLAGMTASIATKTVSNSLRSLNADENQKNAAKSKLFQEIGIQIADTLGQMKGAVMKVGQIASQYKDIFPPEVAQAISKLQRQAPAMPFTEIRAQVESELGQPLEKIFTHFSETPFAAASIGQVHRATLNNGQDVVVKVQYPGVDHACESDLKQIRLVLRMMGMLKIDKDLQDQLFTEIQESLANELNYELEAQNLEIARAFHQKLDSKVIIPQVFKEYSTRHILTLSFEAGESIEHASTWSQELRNELGKRLFTAMGQEIFYLKRFHCDPHPGNLAFRPDGSVVVYDYGGVKQLSTEQVQYFKKLIYAARQSNIIELENALTELQVLTEKQRFPNELYHDWLEILLRPLIQHYDFAENSAHHDGMLLMKASLKYWDIFKPSPNTLMLNRTFTGHYWNLVHLKVKDDLNSLFNELIPDNMS
ncbi:AarF/ABC1/UbiB kinase family protein [Acinetobacter sp. ANC 4635]|uniref:ABC1 kinase family protein n=1 Tax=Acinetobacter sp. ANC 4635 TaxID=2529846 RepID=UPI001038F08E|nr:AarF/ABC1/UbiB kinase family protein [Acinetobacter sp. ANC 4635]TCB31645.1 AarF/ABC1/UbiB kinase family protein [Acinetobacter sp. ANC 4635]